MERKDIEPKVTHSAENMHTGCNDRLSQSTVNNAMDKRELHKQTQKQDKLPHHEIITDQQKTRQVILFLRYYDVNQSEMFTSSHTKILLLSIIHEH